jgi:hypothetical protein
LSYGRVTLLPQTYREQGEEELKSSNKVLTVILIAAVAGVLVYFLSDKGENNGTDSSDQKKKPRNVDEGKLRNGVYRNEYYGMTFRIPEGWHTIDREKITEMTDSNKDMLFGHNPKARKEADLGKERTITLLGVSKYKPMTTMNNAAMVIRSMDISPFVDEVSGSREFVEKLCAELEKYTKGLQVVGGTKNLKVDGRRFHYRDYTITRGEVRIYSRVLVHFSDVDALSAVLSAGDAGSIGELTAVFKTIEFDD